MGDAAFGHSGVLGEMGSEVQHPRRHESGWADLAVFTPHPPLSSLHQITVRLARRDGCPCICEPLDFAFDTFVSCRPRSRRMQNRENTASFPHFLTASAAMAEPRWCNRHS